MELWNYGIKESRNQRNQGIKELWSYGVTRKDLLSDECPRIPFI